MGLLVVRLGCSQTANTEGPWQPPFCSLTRGAQRGTGDQARIGLVFAEGGSVRSIAQPAGKIIGA